MTSSDSAIDLKATRQVGVRRLAVYVGLAIAAILMTSVYHRIDQPDEYDEPDRFLRRRHDWPLVSTARTLVDIMADYSAIVASLQSGKPPLEHRASAVHRAAERLLDVAYDEQAVFGLRYLASVLGHYREHVISRMRSGSGAVEEPQAVDSEQLAGISQSIAELITEAEGRRAVDGNQTETDDQFPVSLSLHPEVG